MRIGVIVAMDKELAELRAALGGESGVTGGNSVVVRRCGVGKVNSALGADELIRAFHPDLIVSTGVAGGAGAGIGVRDVVVGSEYRYHDVYCGDGFEYGQVMGLPAAFTAPRELVGKAASLSCGTAVHPGLIVSGDFFVDTAGKMREILRRFPAAKAVDMESCSIAQTCHVRGVPFISFRIISDIPLEGNNAGQYDDFWEGLARGSFSVTREFLEAV